MRNLSLRDTSFFPWALATAAKESIAYGNEFRASGVTQEDIVEICRRYSNLDDPLASEDPELSTPTSFLVRTAYEQFDYQRSVYADMGRAVGLFDIDLADSGEIVNKSFWTDILGCSVREFVGSGFLFAAGCLHNEGRFDPSWLSQSNFSPIIDEIPASTIRSLLTQFFGRSFDDLRAACRANKSKEVKLRKVEYNPLKLTPLVERPQGDYIAPVIQLIHAKLAPAGIYYEVLNRLESQTRRDAFTRDVGILFEKYVGRQLADLSAVLYPQVEYSKGKMSVDWILVWPSLVVLVEAKASRLSQSARMGTHRTAADVDRSLGRAIRQIGHTARMVSEGHGAFSAIPTDRPIVGLVVTLEPYYLAHSPLALGKYLPRSDVPTAVVSAENLENWVATDLEGDAEQVMNSTFGPDNEFRDLNASLAGRAPGRPRQVNALLDQVWATLPFMEQIRQRSA